MDMLDINLNHVRGGGVDIHMKLYGTCRFSEYHFSAYIPETGIKIDQKFQTSYDYLLKNNRLLFSLLCSIL